MRKSQRITNPIVIVESPFKGVSASEENRNIRYARAALQDSLLKGETPFASHVIYTLDGVLDDSKPEERSLGMQAGWDMMGVADKVVVYTDLGISSGMESGIKNAKNLGLPIEYRSLEEWA